MPTTTHSSHCIPNPTFRRAVANYLEDERRYVERAREHLARFGPYRRGGVQVPRNAPVDEDND